MAGLTSTTEPIRSRSLQAIPGLVHGYSTRVGGTSTVYLPIGSGNAGDLNLGYTDLDDPANVRINRTRWLHALGAENGFRYALLRQTHSVIIHAVRTRDEAASDFAQPGTIPGDGLVTDVPGVLLTVQTADCVPVLLCDPVRRVIGAFHAGWRGTLAGIVGLGVRAMHELYGTEARHVHAAIGPSIGPESYVVSADLEQQFAQHIDDAASLFRWKQLPSGQREVRLDLWKANHDQLVRAGVPLSNINVLALDTATDRSRFFSHRAEHGRTGRMMSSVGLVP